MKDQFSKKWQAKLGSQLDSPYIIDIVKRIKGDLRQGFKVSPSSKSLFSKFRDLDPEDVRVVFFTDKPLGTYTNSPNWQLMSRWLEEEVFNGLNLNPEEDVSYLIKEGVINLSPSLTFCKTDHSKIGWEKLLPSILKILYDSPNKVLFISENEGIKNSIPFNEDCIKYINNWMQKEYNTIINW